MSSRASTLAAKTKVGTQLTHNHGQIVENHVAVIARVSHLMDGS
jgi:ADP-ribosylglycohydrolase